MVGHLQSKRFAPGCACLSIAGPINATLMCGIAGLIDKSLRLGPARLALVAKQMADAMAHRGPDDAGVWSPVMGGLLSRIVACRSGEAALIA